MTAKIIDGKEIAKEFQEKLKEKVSKLDVKPGLAIVLVGNNPASEIYVSSKLKKAEKIGFHCEKHHFPEIKEHHVSWTFRLKDLYNRFILLYPNPMIYYLKWFTLPDVV